MDPNTVSALALIISAAMMLFSIYTYRQKASADQLTLLRVEVQDLKFKLEVANVTCNRLQMENYKLMHDALSKRA